VECKISGVEQEAYSAMLQVVSDKTLSDSTYTYEYKLSEALLKNSEVPRFVPGDYIRLVKWDYDISTKKIVVISYQRVGHDSKIVLCKPWEEGKYSELIRGQSQLFKVLVEPSPLPKTELLNTEPLTQ
jgi:hypothetical protein